MGLLDPMIHIGVSSIKVLRNRRPLNPKKDIALAASMNEIGLQMPITVQKQKNKMVLISGWHRLAAAIRLSWSFIQCLVVPSDKIKNDLWQIAENFYRNDLTVLEHAEAIEALRVLIQQKRASEGGQVAPPGGSQPNDLGINESAKVLGVTREEVRRAKTIAAISIEAKKRVRELGLDNQQALLAVAKRPPDEQALAVEEIIERKRAEHARSADVAVIDEKTAAEINTLKNRHFRERGFPQRREGQIGDRPQASAVDPGQNGDPG
jgi:hypothetical protein